MNNIGWDIDYAEFLQRLRGLRKARGYTQRDIARLLNGVVTNTAISKIERGISPLSMSLFIRLCEIYRADIRWLLTGETVIEALERKAAGE